MVTETSATRRLLAVSIGAVCAMAWASALIAATPANADTASDSAQTVTAAAYDPDSQNSPLPNLRVTVSQTKDLIQQGITVSWTGGKQSTVPTGQTGGANFLQLAQCWGDEPGSNGTRPDRTTCQYGGLNVPSDSRWTDRAVGEAIDEHDESYTAASTSWFVPTRTAIPFASHTGVTLASVADGKLIPAAPDLNSNEFFTKYTTNEISWAGSGGDGAGMVNFELQTLQQSPGLGCGTPVRAASGQLAGSSCWLVVIPRGATDVGRTNVTQSGLLWQNWKHHLAIRLDFKPAGTGCALGSTERQLSGSELVAGAIGQWQPKLCSGAVGSVFSLLTGPESDALRAANGTTPAPLALTSKALDATDSVDHLAYAPIAVTGISVAFAIDRQADVNNSSVPPAVSARERQPFTSLNLTPRLLAKLLTSSYADSLPLGADKSHVTSIRNITQDPDFLAVNDSEWRYMRIVGVGVSDALVTLGRSDAAQQVWAYILSDPAAKAFLDGEPDNVREGDKGNSGMKVNPFYSSNAELNPTHTALSFPRDDFPKSDPTEFPGFANHNYADVVNLVTWRPYSSSLENTGYLILRGDAQALGDWDASAIPPKYGKASRSLVGLRALIGITDTSAAARYQVVQASLRNPAGKFVAPTSATLSAAASAMTSDAKQPQVVGFQPTSPEAKKSNDAYPLALPVYAAANPAMEDAEVRADYAAFITYAVKEGQVPGTNDGQLPDGYAPLPTAWKEKALAAASAIKNGKWPASPSATPSPSISPSPSSSSSATRPSSTTPTTSQQTSAAPTDPGPSGAPAGALTSSATPEDPKASAYMALVPGTAAVGLLAALSVPLISRVKGRRT